jgi:hypothetical protein
MTEAKNTDVKPNKNSTSVDFILIDEEEAEVDFNNLASTEELDPELKELLENLNNNEDIDKAVDALMADIDLNSDFDIEEIKNKIFLLLRDQLARIKSLDEAYVKKILKKREKAIYKHLEALSQYLIVRRAQIQGSKKTIFNKLTKAIPGITQQAKKDFRNMVKRFAIYEVYKIMDPKRIAGETKVMNFVHNMIMGGFSKAHKYEGGKDSDIAHYKQSDIDILTQSLNYKKPIKLRKIQHRKSRGWEL